MPQNATAQEEASQTGNQTRNQTENHPAPQGEGTGLRVAQVCGKLNSATADDVAAMATHLLHEGAAAITISGGGEGVQDLLETGTEHYELPLRDGRGPIGTARLGMQLARILRQTRAQVVHLRSQSLSWPVFVATQLTGLPLIISVDDGLGGVKRAPVSVFRRADCILVPTEAHKENLVTMGVAGEHVIVMPLGYDSLTYNTDNMDANKVDALWAEWDVPSATRVLYVPTRKLEDNAGLDVFITALGQLRHLPFKAIISGNYAHNRLKFTELWQQVEATGLSKHVLFIGTPHDPVNTYAAADVVVCPHIYEPPTSRAPLRAFAMGKPVVATALASHQACIAHDETGLLCPPNDPERLASALKKAVEDNVKMHKMGGRAVKQVHKTHSHKEICPRVFSIYRTLTGGAFNEQETGT